MNSPVSILGLHHFAWRGRDSEETRHFCEDLLGLPLTHVIKSDIVPSTGEYCPYVHIFVQMADGSYIAFFDTAALCGSGEVRVLDGEVDHRDVVLTKAERETNSGASSFDRQYSPVPGGQETPMLIGWIMQEVKKTRHIL